LTVKYIDEAVEAALRGAHYARFDVAVRRTLVAEDRRYAVLTTAQAKALAAGELAAWPFVAACTFGLPEIDDRYHVWRVPLVRPGSDLRVGEIVIDARTSIVDRARSTRPAHVQARLAQPAEAPPGTGAPPPSDAGTPVESAILHGDCEHALTGLAAGSVQLVFTSPPYFNARPDYSEFDSYPAYLDKLARVIAELHRLLEDGRFLVLNLAPVLLRRTSRARASTRLAVPFDVHGIVSEAGFDFVDDIVWEKPEGAGWATGRGRRFAADRSPLQYKPVPVTEYVLVYRKHSDRLIDWHIRNHDPELVRRSRVEDGYERTNIWRLRPASSPLHPAVFPVGLAERVIRYYSFEGDLVLDPFAGIGTVGQAAAALGRRFVLVERDEAYVKVIRDRLSPGGRE
jgi:DNA modification methylase